VLLESVLMSLQVFVMILENGLIPIQGLQTDFLMLLESGLISIQTLCIEYSNVNRPLSVPMSESNVDL
jgi:hypothetical protein